MVPTPETHYLVCVRFCPDLVMAATLGVRGLQGLEIGSAGRWNVFLLDLSCGGKCQQGSWESVTTQSLTPLEFVKLCAPCSRQQTSQCGLGFGVYRRKGPEGGTFLFHRMMQQGGKCSTQEIWIL